MVLPRPIVPEFIRVHLGRPDEYAANVTVSFLDYIKNVASSEIYPTWPTAAIRANMYERSSCLSELAVLYLLGCFCIKKRIFR